MEFFRNERTQFIPLDPKLMFWSVLYYFGAFGPVWLPYKTRCKTGQTGEKLRAMKSHRNFFATNVPDSPHWILNSCFGLFSTIWVHLGLFGCLTKLGAKRVKLVKNFVPFSPIEIFRNKRNRSAPHWTLSSCVLCVSYYLDAFVTVWLCYNT